MDKLRLVISSEAQVLTAVNGTLGTLNTITIPDSGTEEGSIGTISSQLSCDGFPRISASSTLGRNMDLVLIFVEACVLDSYISIIVNVNYYNPYVLAITMI